VFCRWIERVLGEKYRSLSQDSIPAFFWLVSEARKIPIATTALRPGFEEDICRMIFRHVTAMLTHSEYFTVSANGHSSFFSKPTMGMRHSSVPQHSIPIGHYHHLVLSKIQFMSYGEHRQLENKIKEKNICLTLHHAYE
jgi:hypothetical protein